MRSRWMRETDTVGALHGMRYAGVSGRLPYTPDVGYAPAGNGLPALGKELGLPLTTRPPPWPGGQATGLCLLPSASLLLGGRGNCPDSKEKGT